MTACPTLTTERLVLRPLEEADLDAFTAMHNEPEVRDPSTCRGPILAVTPGRAWPSGGASGSSAVRGTGRSTERSTGAFVGRAGLHRPEVADWPGLEVGWALRPAYWGKGYATEAGRRSIAYAFEEMEADEVFSVILPGNERSQAVARRLGLTLVDERVLSSFPDRPTASGGSVPTSGDEPRSWWPSLGGGPSRQRRWSPPSTSTTSPVT